MKTVEDIITAALGRSTFNDPDDLGTPSELVAVVDRRYKQLRAVIGRKAPTFFGTTADVVGDGSKWARPAKALQVVKVEAWGAAGDGGQRKIDKVGKEVNVVPFNDREASLPPRVYQFGRAYYTEGGDVHPSADPAGDQLRFYFSTVGTDLVAKSTELDADWPEQFNDLLVLRLSRYLAIKDGARETEIQALDDEQEEVMATLMMWLETENYALQARHTEAPSRGAP